MQVGWKRGPRTGRRERAAGSAGIEMQTRPMLIGSRCMPSHAMCASVLIISYVSVEEMQAAGLYTCVVYPFNVSPAK